MTRPTEMPLGRRGRGPVIWLLGGVCAAVLSVSACSALGGTTGGQSCELTPGWVDYTVQGTGGKVRVEYMSLGPEPAVKTVTFANGRYDTPFNVMCRIYDGQMYFVSAENTGSAGRIDVSVHEVIQGYEMGTRLIASASDSGPAAKVVLRGRYVRSPQDENHDSDKRQTEITYQH